MHPLTSSRESGDPVTTDVRNKTETLRRTGSRLRGNDAESVSGGFNKIGETIRCFEGKEAGPPRLFAPGAWSGGKE